MENTISAFGTSELVQNVLMALDDLQERIEEQGCKETAIESEFNSLIISDLIR